MMDTSASRARSAGYRQALDASMSLSPGQQLFDFKGNNASASGSKNKRSSSSRAKPYRIEVDVAAAAEHDVALGSSEAPKNRSNVYASGRSGSFDPKFARESPTAGSSAPPPLDATLGKTGSPRGKVAAQEGSRADNELLSGPSPKNAPGQNLLRQQSSYSYRGSPSPGPPHAFTQEQRESAGSPKAVVRDASSMREFAAPMSPEFRRAPSGGVPMATPTSNVGPPPLHHWNDFRHVETMTGSKKSTGAGAPRSEAGADPRHQGTSRFARYFPYFHEAAGGKQFYAKYVAAAVLLIALGAVLGIIVVVMLGRGGKDEDPYAGNVVNAPSSSAGAAGTSPLALSEIQDRIRRVLAEGVPYFNAGQPCTTVTVYNAERERILQHVGGAPDAVRSRLEAVDMSAMASSRNDDCVRAAWNIRYAFDDILVMAEQQQPVSYVAENQNSKVAKTVSEVQEEVQGVLTTMQTAEAYANDESKQAELALTLLQKMVAEYALPIDVEVILRDVDLKLRQLPADTAAANLLALLLEQGFERLLALPSSTGGAALGGGVAGTQVVPNYSSSTSVTSSSGSSGSGSSGVTSSSSTNSGAAASSGRVNPATLATASSTTSQPAPAPQPQPAAQEPQPVPAPQPASSTVSVNQNLFTPVALTSGSLQIVTDGVMGGISTATYNTNTKVFQGTVRTENNGGFASLRMYKTLSFSPSEYRGLYVRARRTGSAAAPGVAAITMEMIADVSGVGQYVMEFAPSFADTASTFTFPFDGRWASEAWAWRRSRTRSQLFDPSKIEMLGFMAIKPKVLGDFAIEIEEMGAYK